MSAGVLPKPGTKLGPCVEECRHTDCTETRRMAASICIHCDGAIGYGVRFYEVFRSNEPAAAPMRVLVHATCREKAALS